MIFKRLRILKRLRIVVNDAVLVIGLSVICLGLAKIYLPIGMISAGAMLVVLAVAPGKKRRAE